MSSLTPWGSPSPSRQHSRELSETYRRAELAEERVASLNHVTQRAIYETMLTANVCQQAMQIAPVAYSLYDIIATAGAHGTAKIITNLHRGW